MRRAVAGCRRWRRCRGAFDRPERRPTPDFRLIPGRLLRVLHGPRLADDRHLDLARIGQLLLDLAHDVAGEAGGGEGVDLLPPDEEPDLAPGLDGKRALDAGETVGDGLEVLQAPDVSVP